MSHPLTTHQLYGHAATVLEQLAAIHATGKLTHSILLTGQKGIGKATLAYQLARQLLGEGESVLSRMLAGSHADLLVIEPLFNEKKQEMSQEITAEQTRKIAESLSLSAGEGGWRVVIIDGAESMNHHAANALLKILEEPPANTLFILVAHHAGRLLPTIRSRCQSFRVYPLNEEDFLDVTRQQLPEAGNAALAKLGQLSDYSPGIAVELYEQGAIDLFDQLELIFSELPDISPDRILAMAEQVGSGKQHQNWQIFSRLVLFLIARQAKVSYSQEWATKWQQAATQLGLCESRHLDYKAVVISFLYSLSTPEPYLLSA